MAGTPIQAVDNVDPTSGTSKTTNIAQATLGNRLQAKLVIDKDATSINTPAGWDIIRVVVTGDVSIAWFTKISDGTETSVTITWTTARTSAMRVTEHSDLPNLEVVAFVDNDGNSVTSRSSGIAATLVADSRAFTLHGADSGANVNTTPALSGGYAITFLEPAAGGAPALIAGELELAATGNQESLFSTGGAGDQIGGIIAVFNDAAPAGPNPTITNADDELFKVDESIVIAGTDFEAVQGTGSVVISPTDNINDAGAVTQTVTAWADGSITVTIVRGALAFDTGMFLFVENDTGDSNVNGYAVQFEPRVEITDTLEDENGSLVVSETAIKASIWRNSEPTGAPDEELTLLTTDGSGVIDFEITRGALDPGDPVYLMLFKDDPVNWQATLVKLVPAYN